MSSLPTLPHTAWMTTILDLYYSMKWVQFEEIMNKNMNISEELRFLRMHLYSNECLLSVALWMECTIYTRL